MFEVNVGLSQDCVMSPWMFNLYMDGALREVSTRFMNRGVKLEKNGQAWLVNSLMHDEFVHYAKDGELVW